MQKNADMTFQNNTLMLSGELDFANVMSVYEKSLHYFQQSEKFTIDFSQLKGSNSAGLALVIEWVKLAKKQHKAIHFQAISADLQLIAKAAGMDHLISLHPEQ